MEKMLRKTGKNIYKLRKTKTASKGQPDLQAFKEKMAFFTNLRNDVPDPPRGADGIAVDNLDEEDEDVVDEEDTASECSTLQLQHKHLSKPSLNHHQRQQQLLLHHLHQHRRGPSPPGDHQPGATRSSPPLVTASNSFSSETVNTLTEEDTSTTSNSNSTVASTSTTKINPTELFTYEVDPDIGVIV